MISVVIIDDNKPTTDRISSTVPWDSMDCSVVSIQYDGLSGKKAIAQYLPDLIISDVMMPGLNGLEVIEITKELVPNSKVIFISAYDSFDYAYKALKLKAYDYLVKPFSQTSLLNTIQNAVKEIKAKKEIDTPNTEDKSVPPMMNRAISFINTHACENITLEEIAENFGMSSTHFGRLIKQATGKRFVELVTEIRVNKAIELLQNTDYKIEEIAYMVGYKNYLTLYKVFIKITGSSPSEYRK